jgi:hypothetical protein
MAHGLENTATDRETMLADPLWSVFGASEKRLRDLTERVGDELLVMSSA